MRTTIFILLAAMLAAPEAASARDAPPARMHCFTSDQFEGWRAADGMTIYIRANSDRYYRLGLARECPEVTRPLARLTLQVPGGGLICSAVDFTLKASEGFPDLSGPCFVKTMTELSPAEAAALPRKFKP
jgi:hypothetical protein